MKNEIPKVQGTYQQYRIWFEYFKLAKFYGTREQKSNLRKLDKEGIGNKQKGFYREWESVEPDTKFDEWYKNKRHLFADTKIRQLEKINKKPNTLNISIPLTETATKSLQQIRELIEAEQRRWWKEKGGVRNPATLKNRSIPANYPIEGEVKGQDQHVIQLVYKLWVELERPTVTSAFLDYVENWFKNRPRSKWLPKTLQPVTEERWDEDEFGPVPDDMNMKKELKNQGVNKNREAGTEVYTHHNTRYVWKKDAIKTVRKQVQKAEQICTAVSKGRFPK